MFAVTADAFAKIATAKATATHFVGKSHLKLLLKIVECTEPSPRPFAIGAVVSPSPIAPLLRAPAEEGVHRCLNAPVFGSDALLYGAGDCWGIGSVGLLLQVFVTGVVLIEP